MQLEKANKLSFFLVYLISLCLILGTVGCASKQEKEADHLKRASRYLESKEYKKAIIELRNVVQLNPENDKAYYDLGEAYLKLNKGREAFQAFSRAVSINANNLQAQVRLGQLYLLGKKIDEAKKKAELVLEKDPKNIEALLLLSSIQVREKDLDSAIDTLERAISFEPKAFRPRLSLARIYLIKHDFSNAEKTYLEAIDLDPKSRIPYLELSQLYARKGELAKAENLLKKLISATPSDYQNLYFLASFCEAQRKFDLAEKYYLEAVNKAPRDDIGPLVNVARYYARRRKYQKAVAEMNKAVERKPENLNLLATLAQLHLDFGKTEEAEQTIDKVLERDKGHIMANFIKGRLYLIRRDFAHASEKFQFVTHERPKFASGYYYLAVSRAAQGQIELAKEALIKTVELNPHMGQARLMLAEIYLKSMDKELAREQIDAVLKMAPNNIRALMLDASLKIFEKDRKGAEERFRQVLKLAPKFSPAYVKLGVLYALENKKTEALDSFKKALEVNPFQVDALKLLAAFFIRDQKFTKAIKLCETYKEKVKDNKRAVSFIEYLEGNISMAKRSGNEAITHYRRAIDLNPNAVSAYVGLARAYLFENRQREAIEEYNKIIMKKPGFLPAYMALGSIYQQEGDYEKAEKCYREALEIKKDFAPAANNLAWILAKLGKNIDEALGYAQVAKEKMPDSAAVMDTLGWIYYLKGSYLNAISEFHDSLEKSPQNPVINFHMGLAQYKINQLNKAKEYIKKALDLDPKFEGASEARKILAKIQNDKNISRSD